MLVLNLIFNSEVSYFNLQTLWMFVCQVFIDEIIRLKGLRPSWNPDLPVRDELHLVSAVEKIMDTMRLFSIMCPTISELCTFFFLFFSDDVFVEYQLSKVDGAFAAI